MEIRRPVPRGGVLTLYRWLEIDMVSVAKTLECSWSCLRNVLHVFQTVTKIKGDPDCGYDRHKPVGIFQESWVQAPRLFGPHIILPSNQDRARYGVLRTSSLLFLTSYS